LLLLLLMSGATSHCLGQNFAKMFKIQFQDEQGHTEDVWQNSWGLTTRTLGVMVMVHSDDTGLVLPPMVAPLQVVIIPIVRKSSKDRERLRVSCQQLAARLQAADIRTELDDSDNNTAGWKFNHWELKGVCLRVEVGDRELESGRLLVQRRDRLEKEAALEVKWEEAEQELKQLLVTMQADMLQRATVERDAQRKQVTDWQSFLRALDDRNTALAPHCETTDCEKQIKLRSAEAAVIDQQQEHSSGEEKEDSKTEKLTGAAKSLCIPFDQPSLPDGQQCIACSLQAKNWTLFGRSY
jgi:prolyl-tRNA synthetase